MARRTAPPAGTGAPDPATRLAIADRIVDETLAVAAEVGWDGVRLRSVAERLGIPLSELNTHYRDLDAIADAWLGRGVAAMLAPPPEGFADRPAAERVEAVVLRFLDALATHRSATAAMVVGKLWPAHPHHWAPLIFNLSRTV
ncbi:MAG: TetR/AcrR family transcriptional regulator, partial [Alphaproteobacteria bacterium]